MDLMFLLILLLEHWRVQFEGAAALGQGIIPAFNL